MQWPEWISGQLSKVTRSVPILAARLPALVPATTPLKVDSIATAVALWYMDKRVPDAEWRKLEGGAKLEAVCFLF